RFVCTSPDPHHEQSATNDLTSETGIRRFHLFMARKQQLESLLGPNRRIIVDPRHRWPDHSEWGNDFSFITDRAVSVLSTEATLTLSHTSGTNPHQTTPP